ncbi:hypothetical protein PAP_09340 [Palaeococcus pacificus DY20341]|uniref:DUF1102 domain-containing protein n=1 Tax=Palaeococcus pacificus DY20341 TaxID=1343739 RepID=A0A075LVQ7_9EURY|nr:DUF1102 domain-containing protein [Palaeococcus pacificus]AIF70246.1 hypothetical protein PAP_09340 [Palaeococcus pacificus DY20341]
MKKILGIFMLIAGIVIAVTASSASFAYFEADREVHIAIVPDDNELIDLRPLQPYAYINYNGMLVIDLSTNNGNWQKGFGEGVSPDSLYIFEHIFGVSNDLWENVTICMNIEYSGSGAVSFFEGDYVGQPGTDELHVTILPGEVVEIGMIIDSDGLDDGDSVDGTLNLDATLGPCED